MRNLWSTTLRSSCQRYRGGTLVVNTNVLSVESALHPLIGPSSLTGACQTVSDASVRKHCLLVMLFRTHDSADIKSGMPDELSVQSIHQKTHREKELSLEGERCYICSSHLRAD